MNGELTKLLELAVTSGPFVLLYWLERRRVREVQDARVNDLKEWNTILTTFITPPPAPPIE